MSRLVPIALSAAIVCLACGDAGGGDVSPTTTTSSAGGTAQAGGAGGSGGSSVSTGGSGAGDVDDGCSEAGEVTYDAPTTEDISFTSSTDGVEIFGRLHIPESGGSFATVVLLHQNCSDLTDWTQVSTLAPDLARAGFLVLHYDARGYGQSTEGGTLDYCNESSAVLFEPMVADLGDAVDFLGTRSEANLNCLAVGGGSLGANVALIWASTDDRTETVVLFSPGLNYLGLSTQNAITDFHPRESLMFATEEDTYSANTLISLSDASDRVTPVTLSGSAHGAAILTEHADTQAQTLTWLAERL